MAGLIAAFPQIVTVRMIVRTVNAQPFQLEFGLSCAAAVVKVALFYGALPGF
jgi:hypothetical protein